MSVNLLLERVDEAVSRGELWRAKEVLQSAIRYEGYDVVVFQRMGLVLLRMDDLPEAGKYLFLSGVREPPYERAISLYVNRYLGKRAKQRMSLYYSFPRAARLTNRAEYPAAVASELAALGFPENLPAPSPRHAGPSPQAFAAMMGGYGCLALIVVVLGLTVLGIIKVVEWVLG